MGMNDRIGLESLGRDVAGGAVSRQTVKGWGGETGTENYFFFFRCAAVYRSEQTGHVCQSR